MSENPQDPPPKPKRRWRRRLGWFCLFLVAFLIWANGPGARWLLTKLIHDQLEKQELSGTFELQGNLTSGLSLHDIDLKGTSLIQKAESRLVKIDWSLSSLIDKHVESLTIDRLHLVLDLDAPPPSSDEEESTDEEESEPADLEETLELVRGIIKPTEISIMDVRVELKEVTTVSLGSLSHPSEGDAFVFENLAGQDHLGRDLNNPSSTLTWNENGFHLDQLAPLDGVALRDVSFSIGEKIQATLQLNEAIIDVRSDFAFDHTLVLRTPPLDLKQATTTAGYDLPIGGVLKSLEVETTSGLIRFKGTDLQWEDQKLSIATIETKSPKLTQPFGQPIEFDVDLEDKLQADGVVTLQEEILDSEASFTFSLSDPRIPSIQGKIDYRQRQAGVEATTLDKLTVKGTYFVNSSTYEASVEADIKDASVLEPTLTGPLQFSLSGKGSIPDETHSGSLQLTTLSAKKEGLPSATARGEIDWNWPESVTVKNLLAESEEGQLQAALKWSEETLVIQNISLTESDVELLSASGKLPAPLEIPEVDELLDSEDPVELTIKSKPLTFKTLATYLPIPENLRGVLQTDLELSGSIANPTLDGFTTLDDFQIAGRSDVPPTSLRLEFATEDQRLSLSAKVREPGGELLDLKGELPFLPRAWIDRKQDPIESEIKLSAITPDIDLKRALPFVPVITSIDGIAKINAEVSGTLAKPEYSGNASVRVKSMRLKEGPLSDLRDINIGLSAAGTTLTFSPSTVEASGGKATLGGTVELGGSEPEFDLFVKGSYLLLNRTADYTVRGNPDLKLRGSLSMATISGSVALVESLIYKDVEILPFGQPRTTEIPKPNLPTFTAKPQPKPDASPNTEPSGGIDNWKLDLTVTTPDPILIRGNLANGEITGNIKIFGTIGDPKTSGRLSAEKLVADLPFSDLAVESAVVTLRPEALTNPFINLKGSSKVGEYEVQVFLSGPVHSPELILTSSPPLPDSEIMLLLATGSASDQLENQDVASQKAMQFLLEGIRRRNAGKEKTVLQRLIKNSDQIQLFLGDTDQFSGRKYSSASLDLTDQWDFTAQIDDEGNTRALLVFSIRFR